MIATHLVGVIVCKRNDPLIAGLEERRQSLFGSPVNGEVEAVKNLCLIGQSQTTFREWNQRWVDLSLNSFSDIESHIFKAKNLNNSFKFTKAKHGIDNVESQLNLVEEDTNLIHEALSALKGQEEKNSARVKHALDLYETLQASISEKEDSFGSTMSEIEKQLKNIEAEFSQFITLNSIGNPVEASEVLGRAKKHTIALGQIPEQVPTIIIKLEDDFPDQLNDLEQGYCRLLEQNYHFAEEDIETCSREVYNSIRANSSKLVTLGLDRARDENEHIQEKIDSLYELFEREIAAHKAALKDSKIIPGHLAHARIDNEQLAHEIKRLSHKYVSDNSESLSLHSSTKNLEEIEAEVLPIAVAFEIQDEPFSELRVVFDRTLKTLAAVEEGQVEVFEQVRNIEEIETVARQSLEQYINRSHTIKCYMEKRSLPGIPQDFLSAFFTTSSQLEVLIDELSRGRIDIKAVSRLTDVVISAIANLENATRQVVQNTTLTKQLLQYSNRHRSFEPSVQSSFKHALKLFEVDSGYQASLDEISYALETIEPGVTDRSVLPRRKTRKQVRF